MVNKGVKFIQMVKNGESEFNNVPNLFLGEYEPVVTKGFRLALPKKIREALKNDNYIVLTRGFEGCIAGYSKDFWAKESAKTLSSSVEDKRSRLLKRYIFSGAFEVEYDTQGRIVIPRNLATGAGINEEVKSTVLIGAGDHFEIWNKVHWLKSLEEAEKELL